MILYQINVLSKLISYFLFYYSPTWWQPANSEKCSEKNITYWISWTHENRLLENKHEGYIGFCFPDCCWQYKWLKALGNFDHAGTFQESVICLHLKMSLTLATMPCTHRNLWTVFELWLSQDWPLLPYIICDGIEKNSSSKQLVKHALVLISYSVNGFIYLLDTISNKNNTLTIYFTTAKLLDKWFKTNTCVFTTLWAIFLETGTLPSQGMKQIMCIGKVSQLKQGVFFHFLPQILTEDRVHWKSQQQGKRQQTRDSNCKHNRSIVRITM